MVKKYTFYFFICHIYLYVIILLIDYYDVYYCSFLPPGITQIYIEIYDECSFVMDELIAWGHIDIPPQVIQKGETHEDWYMLSGKQGDNQEGMINLVFSYTVKSVSILTLNINCITIIICIKNCFLKKFCEQDR